MGVLWWILGIIAALLVLLCLMRVGVHLRFAEEVTVTLRIGPFSIQVLPGREKWERQQKEAKKPRKTGTEKAKTAIPKPDAAEICDAVRTLWQPLKKALNRTRRGVRIAPLDVTLVLGGAAEPADAARLYGELNGAVWAGMPVLEQLLVTPEPHICMDVDFSAVETRLRGTVGLSARVGTLLRIGWSIAVPAVRWMTAFMKKKRAAAGKDELHGNGKEKPAA